MTEDGCDLPRKVLPFHDASEPAMIRGRKVVMDAVNLDRAAYERTAAARSAARPKGRYTLDAFFAAARAFQIASRVEPHREVLLATFPDFDLAHLDGLEDLARALQFVQTQILRRTDRSRLPEVAAEGRRLRRVMMAYGTALSFKGPVAPRLLDRLRRGAGYHDLVEDLGVLAAEFRAIPAVHTEASAPVTRADIVRASELVDEIGRLTFVDKAHPDPGGAALLEERRKLGWLLVRARDAILRCVTYLRWAEGDASKIVPSLYVPGGRRRRAAPRADEG